MYFNNRNRPQASVYGCSSTGFIIVLIIALLMIFGGLFFILRYLGLIIALGLIVWLFRKFFKRDSNHSSANDQQTRSKTRTWSRDFERKEHSSYDNLEREFEEIDEDEMDDF